MFWCIDGFRKEPIFEINLFLQIRVRTANPILPANQAWNSVNLKSADKTVRIWMAGPQVTTPIPPTT